MIIEESEDFESGLKEPWESSLLWLSLLWPEEWTGSLAVCSKNPTGLSQQFFGDSGRKDRVRSWAELSERTGVWLSCCSFAGHRRDSESAKQLPGLWVDLDTREGHRTNRGTVSTLDLPSREEAVAALSRLPRQPSAVLNTGGGLVCWWFFDRAVDVTGDNRRTLQSLLKSWEQRVRLELQGRHLDSTADLARILRVPGFRNEKYGVRVEFFKPQLRPTESFAQNLLRLREEVRRFTLEEMLEAAGTSEVVEERFEEGCLRTYSKRDRDDALQALIRLKTERADEYSNWVKVGLCLAEVDCSETMFGQWLSWSRQSDKFDEAEVDEYRRKWESFKTGGTGFAVANLVSMANEDDAPVEVEVVGVRTLPKYRTTGKDLGSKAIRSFQPFPLSALPGPFDELVRNASQSLQVDPSMVAVPLLSALAGAVGGNSVRLLVKSGWTEPPIVWTVVSAESGTGKTHAFDIAVDSVTEIQRRAFREYAAELESFRILQGEYERQLSQWKKQKTGQDQPEPPRKPVCWRVKLDDTTTEALVARLSENSRGLLVAVDELSGFFGSFDRYASGGGDEAKWLRGYDGKDLTADRKTGDCPVLHVPRAAVSITGTIQPELLRKHFTTDRMESGLVSRFLLVEPPETKREGWTEDEVDPEVRDRCLRIVEKLCRLEGTVSERDEDEKEPVLLTFTESGKSAFVDWCRFHQQIQDDTFGAVRAAYAKLKSVPARVGLVFHLVRRAAEDPTLEDPGRVDGESIRRGRAVAEFFRNEVDRLYSTFGGSEVDRKQRKVLQLVEQRGGEITPRNLSRISREFQPVDTAADLLQALVDAGRGVWREDRPKNGGHVSKVFVAK
jgi:hypothetical protein